VKVEQLEKVMESHKKDIYISCNTDIAEMIFVVEDLLEEEIKYLQEEEPEAVITLEETKIAREVLRNLYHQISDM
jgi:hypothetical protein